MIRWLLIILFIYLVFKLIQGPKRRNNPRFTSQFDIFKHRGPNSPKNKGNFEEIEEAEFEDITDTDKEKKNKEP